MQRSTVSAFLSIWLFWLTRGSVIWQPDHSGQAMLKSPLSGIDALIDQTVNKSGSVGE